MAETGEVVPLPPRGQGWKPEGGQFRYRERTNHIITSRLAQWKVAQIPHAANLYKQTGAAWSIYGVTLFDLCMRSIREDKISGVEIKDYLEEYSE